MTIMKTAKIMSATKNYVMTTTSATSFIRIAH